MTDKPLGMLDRVKAAGKMLVTGKQNNPLAEPSDKSRASLVMELQDWATEHRKFWKPVFDRIRQEQRFATGKQWPGELPEVDSAGDEAYIGDMIQQLVNRKTAVLYSKNPTPEAKLRERMNFEIWDGEQETIDNCKKLIGSIAPQALQAHEAEIQGQDVPPPPPQMGQDIQEAQQILADYQKGMAEKAMLKRVATTGELLIKQQWDEQTPSLLACGKQATTRVITSRVAFVKVMYKRDEETVPTESANKMSFDDRLASLQAQLKAMELDPPQDSDSGIEETRLLKENLQKEIQEMEQNGDKPADEGVVLDWLSATSVLVDRRCKCLREFIGAHRIAHEIMMTVDECEKTYGISLRGAGAKYYQETGSGWETQDRTDYQDEEKPNTDKMKKLKVCVWEMEDKDTGLCYTVCDGVKDFLREPYTNEPEVNRFWSIVPITFNCVEVETNDPKNDATIYPRSDVRLMMPMQINVNLAGHEKRMHRAANRPAWIGVKSKFASTAGKNDLDRLKQPRSAHDVFMLETLQPGEKVADFLQPLPKQEFDQWLYDNGQDQQAMMEATGVQAADLGQQRPDEKATGQNIAAQARATVESSNIDDWNFAWSTIAQMMFEMLISPDGMPAEIVKEKVGRGAVWADQPVTREMIADSIFFQIEAGSMSKPNAQSEMEKGKIIIPQILEMLQAMGRSPEPVLKLVIRQLDANIDVDDLLKESQVLPPPAPPQEQQKPPSVSISANIKDLPLEEQNQAVAMYYKLKPAPAASRLITAVGHDKAIQAAHENSGGGQENQKQPK